jgi:hypothetical protein
MSEAICGRRGPVPDIAALIRAITERVQTFFAVIARLDRAIQ